MNSFFASLMVMATATPVALADDRSDDLVPVDASAVFAPVGFDDNDEAMVVLDGYLPNSCYRLAEPEVNIDQGAKIISITPRARLFTVPCIDALVPYWQEVKLGLLAYGDYKIVVRDGLVSETLRVAEATNAGPDDYLYAAIDAAYVDKPADADSLWIKVQGRFTNTCMVLDELKVIDTGKTVNVLPLMHLKDQDDCQPSETAFRRMVAVPASVSAGRHLLHVRSLNGRAVNNLFNK